MSAAYLSKITKDVADVEIEVRGTEDGIPGSIDIKRMWTARGYGWQAMATTELACLIIRPTTVAMATLYNNTAKNFVIERVSAYNVTSIANGQFGIWLCTHPIGMTAPTNDMSTRNSCSGLTSGSEGIWDSAATVVDNGWFPWGESNYSVTATVPGTVATAEVDGRIIIPPTAGLSVSCVGQTAVITVKPAIHWFSVPVNEFATG